MSRKTFNTILITAIILILTLFSVVLVLFKNKIPFFASKKPQKVVEVKEDKDKNKDKEVSEEKEKPEEKPKDTLDYLKPYLEENEDLVAWIKVPNTRVNYPVVYRKGDVNEFYYLRRNFKKQNDIYGVPFVDGHIDLDSNNILIHGHETDNGTQFHDLNKYKNFDFWKKNPTFTYDTLTEAGTYEIFAVFYDEVHGVNDKVFKYYFFYGSEVPEEFNDYVKNVKAKSLYDTGITPEFGDKLVTLSLCDYYKNDGRFVVVARKVK